MAGSWLQQVFTIEGSGQSRMPHSEGLTGGGLSGMVRRGRRQRHISRPRSLSLEASALGMRETTDPLDVHPLVCIERLLGSGDSDHS